MDEMREQGVGISDFSWQRMPMKHYVAVYWPGEGLGGAKPFDDLWDAEDHAAKLIRQGYKEVHVDTTTKHVFKLKERPPA